MVEEELGSSVGGSHHRYIPMTSEPLISQPSFNSLQRTWIFDELPIASIVSVSRPDAGDISPMLLSYTIELQYKQFKWQLHKKAAQVMYLHFTLKKRAIIEEIHEKQDKVKEWFESLGIGDHPTVVQDEDDDDAVHLHQDESAKNRDVPSSAALPIIRPALGRQHSISDRAKVAMQGYLSHFLGNMDIVNSPEVCKFLEVSRLSFATEYGPKLKEDYVMVKHLPKISKDENDGKCCSCQWFSCCNDNWKKVWGVLKPGFLALLEDPFDTKLLDIIVFDVLPPSDGNGEGRVALAEGIKDRNPLRYALKVSCGNRNVKLRVRTGAKVRDWVAAINDAGLRPPEGWCNPHRFGSFAPPRGLTEDGSEAQWFVDGQAAFGAIASAIEEAKSEIFITDWWLCPELYLRRPFQAHESSRLDAILEAKAKQGVQIFILLYKEVAIALKINSDYSKKKLLSIHENVRVLRYPDHFSTGVYLWSHHEKLVIVDYRICFIGGLDLCFGRYDTYEHKVGDFPPQIWPGKDYYNPRESEPNSWEDTMKDELDRGKYPRMPWHDVHCALWGPPCRDIARHFVQRWNFAKRNKAPNEQAIPLLMPQHHMVIPHYMGKSREIENASKEVKDNHLGLKRQDSFSSRSSLQDIPLLLPHEPDGVEAGSGTHNLNGLDTTHNLVNQPSRVSRSHPFSFRKSKGDPLVSDFQMEDFVDDIDSMDLQRKMSLDMVAYANKHGSEKEWWETQERGDQVASVEEAGQVGPRTTCRCQVVRSVGQWSAGTSQTEDSIHGAYCTLIEKAEYFIYIENQFFISGLSGDETIRNRVLEALYRRIMRAYKEQKFFRVIIVIPLLPGFQGGLDDGGAASVRALLHWQYRTICRGSNSILHNLFNLIGPRAHEYISFYGLRTYGRLSESGPLATSEIYVHSKVMIIDDHMALIGSANINDRSLLGSRDSEIGIIIEDKEFVESSMNGKPWKAGKFTFSLRLSLWSEHLGLRPEEVDQITDPVVDATYKDIWMATAKTNTTVYQDVFACIPNDLIHSRVALRQNLAYWKERLGHTTIDLGIAPEKLESYQNGDIKATDPIERLKSVKGFLVSFPLDFMCQEDLRPVFNESEYYASPQFDWDNVEVEPILPPFESFRGETIVAPEVPPIDYDWTSHFPKDLVFETRDKMKAWLQNFGFEHKMTLVVKKSDYKGRNPRAIYSCKRSGKYKPPKAKSEAPLTEAGKNKKKKNTGTRKCECPFEVKFMKKQGTEDFWELDYVKCGIHNHTLSPYIEGHAYHARLKPDEESMYADLNKGRIKPKAALGIIKDKHPKNCSSLQTMYNVKKKLIIVSQDGRTEFQQINKEAVELSCVVLNRRDYETDLVEDFFFAHPDSISLAKCFLHVFAMDCTYKTYRYG